MNQEKLKKKTPVRFTSFGEQFGDSYDHPFNEEMEYVLLDWPADI